MSRGPVELPPDAWDERLAAAAGAGPYHSAGWGRVVASAFGGDFRGFLVPGEVDALVPVLVGGGLAARGFVCGHIGYGGVLACAELALASQLQALRQVERALGAPCLRYVTAPRRGQPADGEQLTMLLPLAPDPAAQWQRYDARTRNMIRKAERSGLRVGDVDRRQGAAALALVQATQRRVGAAYATPAALLDGILGAAHLGSVVGCFHGDTLVAVGVFVRFGRTAAYYLNGWDDAHRASSPNYLMLHAAFTDLAASGVHTVDLGFSHSPELLATKRRWGAEPAAFRRIDPRTSGGDAH